MIKQYMRLMNKQIKLSFFYVDIHVIIYFINDLYVYLFKWIFIIHLRETKLKGYNTKLKGYNKGVKYLFLWIKISMN